MSVSNDAIKHAVMVGYRVDKNGNVFYKNRPRVVDFTKCGYARFRIKDTRKKCVNVQVHRLQAYQKFGDLIFTKGTQVRHLNNDHTNNSWDNIGYGTPSENSMDRPVLERLASGQHANSFLIKHDARAIKKDFHDGMSRSEIMKKYGISSTGTYHHIINNR